MNWHLFACFVLLWQLILPVISFGFFSEVTTLLFGSFSDLKADASLFQKQLIPLLNKAVKWCTLQHHGSMPLLD